MTDEPPAPGEGESGERRQNVLFRHLIDEMLVQIRELQQHSGPWPPDERARVEEDLERIMRQVRGEALRSDR